MRSVTHRDPAALQLLKTLLEALGPRGEESVDGKRDAPLKEQKGAPSPPQSAASIKTPPGSPPRSDKPAPVAADAVAAQMLATLMAEDAVSAVVGGEREGRATSEHSAARAEEPALAQAATGTANGAIPWPNQALAAYSAHPRGRTEAPEGRSAAHAGLGGGSDPSSACPNMPKLFRRALVYAGAITAVVVLLSREALFG